MVLGADEIPPTFRAMAAQCQSQSIPVEKKRDARVLGFDVMGGGGRGGGLGGRGGGVGVLKGKGKGGGGGGGVWRGHRALSAGSLRTSDVWSGRETGSDAPANDGGLQRSCCVTRVSLPFYAGLTSTMRSTQ